jgi:hypothetical protein
MLINDPEIPPISIDPSTIKTPACGPTSAVRSVAVTSKADRTPMSKVTRPSASVTVLRVRFGRR